LLETPEIAATGFELGVKKNTFVRRARTQRSPDYNSDKTPGNKIDKIVEETNRFRDLELNRLEMFFKLISRKNIDSVDLYDTCLMVGSQSFKYYEAKIAISFHRLHDYND